MIENQILVSACIITYNHEKYIKDAIEGALMQDVDFGYEIVIGEDCSTDNTLKICEEYQKKHPSIIRILKRERNLGMNGNWLSTIRSAKGKYIAICEGDDYWTDKNKIKRQVDFLEKNPKFSMHSHECYYINPFIRKTFRSSLSILFYNWRFNGLIHALKIAYLILSNRDSFWKKRRNYQGNKRYGTGDINTALKTAFNKRYIHSASMMARAEILKKMPDQALNYWIGHATSIVWTSLFGLQKHSMDVMACRRVQEKSSAITKREKRYPDKALRTRMQVKLLEKLNDHCPKKSRDILKKEIAKMQLNNEKHS